MLLPQRSKEEAALLWRIAENGARPGGRAMFLDELGRAHAQELINLGMITEVTHSCFLLTEEASRILKPATEAFHLGDLQTYTRPHVEDQDKTVLELLIDLQKSGWQQVAITSGKRKKSAATPVESAPATVYTLDKKMPHRSYLLCLKTFPLLSNRGLKSLHHFQLESCLVLTIFWVEVEL